METNRVTNQLHTANTERLLPADELKRLTDFFSLLIQIDRRVNIKKTYAKQIK